METGDASYYMTPLQAERHPHFVSLLRDLLENKLSCNLVTKTKDAKRLAALKDYTKTKKDYDAVKLIYDCLWEIIIDSDSSSHQEKCELENALVTAELQQSAKIVKGEKWMLPFGNEIQTSGLSVDVQLAVQRQLKNKLTNKGVEILKQMGQDVDGKNQELLSARLRQLPSLVSCQLEEKIEAVKELEVKMQNSREQHAKCTTTLLESLNLMEDLLKQQLLNMQHDQYQVNGQHLKAQVDALVLKIRSLHLEILCETYNKDTIPALSMISKQLMASANETRSEIESCRTRLERYQSVGKDFNNLVQEYRQIKEAIQQKKWTLDKLKSYCK